MTAQDLKTAILQLAVQGKLVPQDSSDEPASELLKRINAEEEQLNKQGKIKKEKILTPISDDEVPFDIPESWEWVHIDQIATSNLGKTMDKAKNSGEECPYLCSINVYWKRISLSTVKTALFSEEEKRKYALAPGDLLICEGGEVGRSAVWESESEMYYQNALHRVRFYDNINPYFFCYLMEFLKNSGILEVYSKGQTIKHLVQSALCSIWMPLPPIAEQQRIVSRIEELMPLVEEYGKAEEQLTALNTEFPDKLRKSILQQAIQGKLTERDPHDEPASELLKRIRAEKEKLIKEGKIKKEKPQSPITEDEIPFEIPDGWEWVRLNSICSLIADIDHNMPKAVNEDEGVLFLSAKDLLDDGTINYTKNVKYISMGDFERLSQKVLPQRNDIIYSRIGAALGKARLVENDIRFLVSYSCCIIRPLCIDPSYLRLYLESPIILAHSIEARQSIGVPDLGMGEIKKYLIALPPLEEQKRIVDRLNDLLAMCDELK